MHEENLKNLHELQDQDFMIEYISDMKKDELEEFAVAAYLDKEFNKRQQKNSFLGGIILGIIFAIAIAMIISPLLL